LSNHRSGAFGAGSEPGPGDRISDHEVLSEVARGGMATVLRVRDVRSGAVRALKLLLPLGRSEETQTRFRREFRALLRLHHPNVLRVYEWGMLGERPWFTMELVEGHDLRAEAERLTQLPPEARFRTAEHLVVQIARALAYVHERGLVHRDVTPGNVMVGPDGSVKLMDFGVVKETDADLTAAGELIGTAAYMAPEQISGDPVDARADLYSLGAVMYLLLTGKRPFQAHTLHGFLEKHLNATPRPPRELVPEVPERLEEVCLRLLHKAPDDRFASASHLLYVLGDRTHGEDLEDRWPPRTVGRTPIRARIRDAIEEVASGRPGQALLLCGPAGLGKTRILELAELIARARGVPVAMGQCRLQDRPFGAFAAIHRALRGTQPPPLLEEVFRGSDERKPIERYRVLTAFKELVVDRAPVVLLVDDVDSADPATVELLVYLIRNTIELSDEPVLFVLSHENAAPARIEGARAHATRPPGRVADRQDRQAAVAGPTDQRVRGQLEALAPVEAIDVPPLSHVEVEELVVGILGSDAAALGLADRLAREGEGSPSFIVDMLRGLIDDELIVEEITGVWRLTVDEAQITQSHLPMPPSLRHALQERLAPLSEDALTVGRVLALARRRIELDVLVEAAPFPEDRVMEALDTLVDAGIVAEHRAADRELVELSHGRFREVLIEKKADGLRLDHQRLGEALERHHRGQLGAAVDELAHQFERAELWPKAYRYLVSSANRHLQRSLYQEALVLLEKALGMEALARPFMLLDSADRRLAEVWLSISRARHGLGQLPEAVVATTEAQRLARLVRDPGLESRVAAELGSQLRLQGRLDEAEAQLQSAIGRAEEAGDQTLLPLAMYELGGARWSRGDLEGAEQHWKRALQIAQQVGDERAQGHGFNGLAVLAICRGQPMEARRHLEQSTTVFERLGMLGPLVVARSNLIEVYADSGVLRKALALADRTLSQSEEASFPQGIAIGKGWRSRVLVRLGRLDEAEREAEQALAVVRRLEIREDEAVVLCARVEVALAREATEEALDRVRELQAVLAIHDAERITHEVRGWEVAVLARLGRTEEAARLLDQAPPRTQAWPHVQVRTELAVGRALAALGRDVAAREALQRALALSEANGFRFFQLLAHLALHSVVDDASVRDRHDRVASGLARSLAANLPPDEASRFLAHHGVA
jgi:eukaryotic-like serine/threonine-protein kinase